MYDADQTSATPQESRQSSEQEAQDLERVRDILFGRQAKETERRMTELEENLDKQISEAREKAQQDAESLQTEMQEQQEAFRNELKADKEERDAAQEQFSKEILEAIKVIDDRLAEFVESTNEDKVDRTQLARMFREVSDQLENSSAPSNRPQQHEQVEVEASLSLDPVL